MCITKRVFYMLVLLSLLIAGCQPLILPADAMVEPEIFVRGADLPGIFDVAVGPDGLVYAASELGRALMAVDPESGEIVERFDVGNDTPHAMTIAPDGTPYWSSFFSLNLCRITGTNGKVCQQMPVDTWGLAFAPDGRLFATADAHVESIYEVDPQLESPPRHLIHLGSLLAHFAFGPDGMIYAPLLLEGTIVRVDVDAEPVTAETVVEGLTLPWAVAFDSSGQMHVAVSADAVHNEIVRADLETGESEVVADVPVGYHNIAFGPEDQLYIAHFEDGALYELSPDGELEALTQPGMIGPGGLAARARPDGGESVFVAGWKTLHEFDGATGEQLNAWRTSWFPDVVTAPRTVAIDGDNLLLSTWADQWGGNVIQIWDPVTGSPVAGETEFAWSTNAVPFQDDIVIVESAIDGSWHIERVDGEDMARREPIGGQSLEQPIGLAVADDNLWATDCTAGAVVQVIADGVALAEPVVIAEGLDHPEGIAPAPDGRLLVAETGTGRLLAIDPDTGVRETVAEGLGFMAKNPTSIGPVSLPAHYHFSGVAVGPSGNIYVTGDGANVIYRIPLDGL